MAHDIWKDNITLFLKGCRTCWSYKVLKFAFVADITKFDPDKAYFSQHVLDAICTFSFDERLVMNCVNTLYETRYSIYVGICPKTEQKKYNQHLHSYLSGAQFYNLTTFRMGAWKIKVNSTHLHHW